MAVLVDKQIKQRLAEGSLIIKGYKEEYISMASIDLTLSNMFKVFRYNNVKYIDPREGVSEELMERIEKTDEDPIIIHPGELVLGSTAEYVEIPHDLLGRLDGRSSLARLGIVVHSTAGSIDPGFKGQITLEIANLSKVPVCLYPGMRICRLTLDKLETLPEITYDKRKDAKYINNQGPAISRIQNDFKK